MTKTTKQGSVKSYAIPFGPTSRKQQMIFDSEAQILIIGGEHKRHNTQ